MAMPTKSPQQPPFAKPYVKHCCAQGFWAEKLSRLNIDWRLESWASARERNKIGTNIRVFEYLDFEFIVWITTFCNLGQTKMHTKTKMTKEGLKKGRKICVMNFFVQWGATSIRTASVPANQYYFLKITYRTVVGWIKWNCTDHVQILLAPHCSFNKPLSHRSRWSQSRCSTADSTSVWPVIWQLPLTSRRTKID